jgi:signal transduction histidine kinase
VGLAVKAQQPITTPATAMGPSGEVVSDRAGTFANKRLLKAALASAPILVWAADRDGTLLAVEGGGTLLAGFSPETAQGRPCAEIFRDVPELLDQFHQAVAGEPATGTAVLHDGFLMDCWAAPLQGPDGTVAGAVGVAVDVTTRDLAQRRLLAELRRSGNLLQSYEQDRRLMAHELHDGLVQEATAAQMRLEALLASDRVAPGLAAQELEVVLGLIRDTVQEARQFIQGIRPPVLEERGLAEAVRQLIAEQPPAAENAPRPPVIELAVSLGSARLQPLLETTVYRIVQEALNNVRRHSRSLRAEVRITQLGDRVKVEIRDWGVGFDPDCVDNQRFGLKGIRQRALALHGLSEIHSALGKGTRVLVDLPLAEASQGISFSNDRSIE